MRGLTLADFGFVGGIYTMLAANLIVGFILGYVAGVMAW